MSNKPQNSLYGLPDFSMTIQRDGNDIGVQMGVGMTEFSMGHISLFDEGFNKIVPDDALLFLTAHWPAICGPYSGAASSDAEINLAEMLEEKHSPVTMRRSGVYIGFDAIRPRVDLGAYSIVVIECLLRLGDVLHDIVDNDNLKASWAKARSVTQLLSMAEERYGTEEPDFELDPNIALDTAVPGSANEEFWKETEWFANQLGQTLIEYCSIAYWLDSRNILAATDQTETSPTSEEWAWETMGRPLDLPSFEHVISMVHRAAKAVGNDPSSVAKDALASRNSSARQIVVYAKWFGSGRDRRPTHAAGLVTGAFHVELAQFDPGTGVGRVKTRYRGGDATLKAVNPEVTAVLQDLLSKQVIVYGTATYTAEQKTPLSINVSKAEFDPLARRKPFPSGEG